MKKLEEIISCFWENFVYLLAATAIMASLAGVAAHLLTPSEAHADSGQTYQQGQIMQRLVKAEEDQAKALQQIVRQLERVR